jgi:hypothetical protein
LGLRGPRPGLLHGEAQEPGLLDERHDERAVAGHHPERRPAALTLATRDQRSAFARRRRDRRK